MNDSNAVALPHHKERPSSCIERMMAVGIGHLNATLLPQVAEKSNRHNSIGRQWRLNVNGPTTLNGESGPVQAVHTR